MVCAFLLEILGEVLLWIRQPPSLNKRVYILEVTTTFPKQGLKGGEKGEVKKFIKEKLLNIIHAWIKTVHFICAFLPTLQGNCTLYSVKYTHYL